MKESLSLVPEIKAEYETVYNEKSRALKIQKKIDSLGLPYIRVIDSEIDRYGNLSEDLKNFFPEIKYVQVIGNGLTLIPPSEIDRIYQCATRAVSGEEYLVLPIIKNSKNIFLPEMSVHFLIMYLLGMIARYHPETWGNIIKGEESGEIYIIKKFLDTTTRKFPNLILNRLTNRNFVFVSPQLETEKRLEYDQLEEITEHVKRRIGEELRMNLASRGLL